MGDLLRGCSKCYRELPTCMFSSCSGSEDGMRPECKDCARRYRKQYLATPEGRAVKMWGDIRQRAGNANGRNPSYAGVRLAMSRDEFLAWAVPALADFMSKNVGVSPSVDRVNPDGNYSIDNLRIISWAANSRLARRKKAIQSALRTGRPWLHDIKDPSKGSKTLTVKANPPAASVPPGISGTQQRGTLGFM